MKGCTWVDLGMDRRGKKHEYDRIYKTQETGHSDEVEGS